MQAGDTRVHVRCPAVCALEVDEKARDEYTRKSSNGVGQRARERVTTRTENVRLHEVLHVARWLEWGGELCEGGESERSEGGM